MNMSFTKDGYYTVNISAKDKSDNEADTIRYHLQLIRQHRQLVLHMIIIMLRTIPTIRHQERQDYSY